MIPSDDPDGDVMNTPCPECNSPTPETDAFVRELIATGYIPPAVLLAKFTMKCMELEQQRDEARRATERAKSFKRVLKNENKSLRRQLYIAEDIVLGMRLPQNQTDQNQQ